MPKNTPIRIIDSQKTRAASFLGGSATAGGTTDHGLLLGLADDDHIQYLRADGTRTLTGNMLVSASVTIDGVDISAHAADANAHHAKQHAITDSANHTVTGSQYQIVGLTSTNTLGLLTAASSPTTNQIVKTDGSSAVTLVDLTVSSDLFMTGTLDFGTNTIAEDGTYLQFAGSKALRFAQNIGNANWTLYNAGGYTTTGSISITGTAGDLTVGSNVLFVDNSGNNVGIACVPDSQFALDVAGPARAQYFIGPHAIQLKDATMILHYDGAAPYKTNFDGILLGHKGQVATAEGGYTFRPGKFGKALQLAPATTNLVTHPSFELGTVGSTPTSWTLGGAGTFVKSADVAYAGDYSAKLTLSAQYGYPTHTLASTINLANAYTVSAWVWVDTYTSGTLTLSLQRTDTFVELATVSIDTSAANRKKWQRVAATYAGGGSTSKNARVKFESSNPATMVVYVDAVQVEQVAYCTPYCDGTLNPVGSTAHAWTGTAHASTSTRTLADVYYSIANVDPREGTVSAWVWVEGFYNYNRLFHFRNDDGSFDCFLTSAGAATFRYNSVSTAVGTLTARTWNHIAVTWSLETGKATTYLNGVQGAQSNITGPTLIDGTLMSIGHKWGASPINGMIDDFAIMSTAADANQIRAIYESNAPVFAESSTVSWVATPGGLVWADAEGLWMKDTAGNPVFGIYGGAATKSWSAFTLSPGDLVIGNNATSPANSAAILWSKTNGTFGFYGAGGATPQVEVSTTGSITAGAGALALNSSGVQITAPSSQTSIGTYKFLVTGKTITSGLSAYYNSGADTYFCGVSSNSSNIGNITTGIDATLGGGGTAKILFGLTNSLSSTSTVYTLSGGSSATWWFGSGSTTYVGINTAAAPTRSLQVVGGLFAGGEETGLTGYTQITNGYNTTQSSGVGTVKMTSTTNRNNDGFIKVYLGVTAYWIPFWGTIN